MGDVIHLDVSNALRAVERVGDATEGGEEVVMRDTGDKQLALVILRLLVRSLPGPIMKFVLIFFSNWRRKFSKSYKALTSLLYSHTCNV